MIIQILLTVNRYLHDFAAAMWVSVILILYILDKEAGAKKDVIPLEFMVRVYRKLNVLFWISFFFIFFCGTVRAITYRQFEWDEKMGLSQIWLLLIKHIIFFLMLILGFFFWCKFKRGMLKKDE